MKAVVYSAPETYQVREVPDPVPAAGEVLIRVERAGVCGTDLHLHKGEFGPVYPLVPGHEFTGTVIGAADDVADIAVGTRVAVDNTVACGSCADCRRARPAYCRRLVAYGVNAPGGFAELVTVPAARCFPVDDLAPDVAVFAEPAACVVHGLDVLDPAPGASALLFGAGPTGIILAQLLKSLGGVGDLTVAAPSQPKLDLVMERGADAVVRMDRKDPAAALQALERRAPEGFDIVIDATGSVSVLELTVPLTRTGGTVMVYGMTAESARWPVPSYDVFRRELTVKGSFAQQFSFDRAIGALRSGAVDTTGVITHRFGLEEYVEALNAVGDSACIKAVIQPGS